MAGRTRTTKKLAQRIDRGYLERVFPIPRWKGLLSIGFTLVGLAWVGWGALSGKQAFNAGPLSRGHSLLTRKCTACHVSSAGFGAKVTGDSCQSCHDGPTHKGNQPFTPACTSCHIEHQGAFQLANVGTSACSQCHANLKTTDGKAKVNARIADFAGHPEFDARRDPGTLKFGHAVHMKKDLKGPEGPVQLRCEGCHRSEGRAKFSPLTASDFQRDCQSCHPLRFDENLPDVVPHKDTAAVLAFVRSKYGADTANIAAAERLLWQKTCKECHAVTYPIPDQRPEIPKAAVTQRWMRNARFDHGSHQLVHCTECHKQASTGNNTSDVMLPGIATCRACHRDSENAAGSRCSECHVYHDWTKAKPAHSPSTVESFRL